jgi:transcriptional regulator with XRE-family HTH domain|nr:MAG TPA: ESX-1 secretion-associated regulator [Caudoviricetes sp.]
MDIVLERILSLIPKGPDGKYVHGAKTKFAKKIGYNDGAIVAMWENGSSISYNKKLYQIAEEYNVSVEWLQGKTEDKSIKETPDPKIEGVSAEAQEILDYIRGATPAELAEVCRYIGYLKSKRSTE